MIDKNPEIILYFENETGLKKTLGPFEQECSQLIQNIAFCDKQSLNILALFE